MVHAQSQSRAGVTRSVSPFIGGGNFGFCMNCQSKLTNYEEVEVWTQADRVYPLRFRKYFLKLETFLQGWQQVDDLEMNLRAYNADIAKTTPVLRYSGVEHTRLICRGIVPRERSLFGSKFDSLNNLVIRYSLREISSCGGNHWRVSYRCRMGACNRADVALTTQLRLSGTQPPNSDSHHCVEPWKPLRDSGSQRKVTKVSSPSRKWKEHSPKDDKFSVPGNRSIAIVAMLNSAMLE